MLVERLFLIFLLDTNPPIVFEFGCPSPLHSNSYKDIRWSCPVSLPPSFSLSLSLSLSLALWVSNACPNLFASRRGQSITIPACVVIVHLKAGISVLKFCKCLNTIKCGVGVDKYTQHCPSLKLGWFAVPNMLTITSCCNRAGLTAGHRWHDGHVLVLARDLLQDHRFCSTFSLVVDLNKK